MKERAGAAAGQIAAVSRAILRIIEQDCPRDAFGAAVRDFVLLQPTDLVQAPPRGFSLLLYAVSLNTSLRNQGRRRGVTDAIAPRLALDLHYLITPWSDRPEEQQRMLTWVIEFVDRHPHLDSSVLNGLEHDSFRDHAGVQLLLSSADVAEQLQVLASLTRPLPVSVPCIARLVIGGGP